MLLLYILYKFLQSLKCSDVVYVKGETKCEYAHNNIHVSIDIGIGFEGQ